MIKVSIIGGAGYTAGELIRILLNHPEATVTSVLSQSHAGEPICSVHNDLIGDTGMKFSSEIDQEADVVFLCLGHGKSVDYLTKNQIPAPAKIIDLSTDFRHKANAALGARNFIYGLPELNREAIVKANNIANPGCFATAIQLALLPLAKAGLLKNEVHVNAITGSTGAGQAPTETTHFSWRNNNISVYKPFTHQHLTEITESIVSLQSDFDRSINFIPVRGNFTRGIFASAYTECSDSVEKVKQLYADFYESSAFTHLSDTPLHLKQVVNTNKCLLHLEKYSGKLLITSIIDNLTKGASGQAIQNMNLIFGLPEKQGLQLKSTMF